jgi:membrane protein
MDYQKAKTMTARIEGKVRFRLRDLPSLIKETAVSWNKDDPWRLSAVVAYYAILSLPGLLVIIITMLSSFWGSDLVEGRIYNEIKLTMGESAANSIRSIIENSQNDDRSLFATIIGICALIYGATGVFYHLQISINRIWGVVSEPKSQFIRYLLDRSKSFGFVIIIGFLLLTSFIISALLKALQVYIVQWLPDISYYLLSVSELVISLGVITLLFALIFKYLPDVIIGWRSVWIGAIITSVLFTAGKEILSYYFSETSPGSVYGAAGSIVIILLWVSYSCLILFFGAEFTWVYTNRYGHKFRAKSHARLNK